MMLFNLPQTSFADNGILIDCDKSPAFTKRLNASVKKLEGRLTKYEVGTPPALALQQQIDQTKSRFARYAESGLLCGTDGLPHLITDGDFAHASEFVLPGILFLYITGWIGWSGRKYIQTVATSKNPTEKEIIIDVPLALNIMLSGYLWPLTAWSEFISGSFVADSNDITVSPR
jgi:photosystem I subunit 3